MTSYDNIIHSILLLSSPLLYYTILHCTVSTRQVVQNGTATMIPLPPGVIPPNFLPGAPPPNTPEGQHLMRSFIMDQQRAFQQQMGAGGGGGHNNNSSSFSFPLFPPGMSEEDIHEFMQDPENQGKIKVIMA